MCLVCFLSFPELRQFPEPSFLFPPYILERVAASEAQALPLPLYETKSLMVARIGSLFFFFFVFFFLLFFIQCPWVFSFKIPSLDFKNMKVVSPLKMVPISRAVGPISLEGWEEPSYPSYSIFFLFPGIIQTNSTASSCFILRAESATLIAGSPPSAIYGFTALKITVIYSLLH